MYYRQHMVCVVSAAEGSAVCPTPSERTCVCTPISLGQGRKGEDFKRENKVCWKCRPDSAETKDYLLSQKWISHTHLYYHEWHFWRVPLPLHHQWAQAAFSGRDGCYYCKSAESSLTHSMCLPSHLQLCRCSQLGGWCFLTFTKRSNIKQNEMENTVACGGRGGKKEWGGKLFPFWRKELSKIPSWTLNISCPPSFCIFWNMKTGCSRWNEVARMTEGRLCRLKTLNIFLSWV